jgi:predicted RND superfamily exporter protein
VLRDVGVSAVACFALVMLAMFGAFRAKRAVFALCLSLGVGCALTFGFTRIVVGHLNSSTAFLGSVVAGNGINFGIILLWRYLEERRRGADHPTALRTAMAHTAVPTMVAAAAAGTAYLSLTITTFRGFSEFGIIAGSGMVVCWMVSFLLLPALLTALERRGPLVRQVRARTRPEPSFSRLAASPRLRLAPLAIVAVSVGLGLYGALRLAHNPFDDDLRALRSRSLPESAPGRWSRRLDAAFGRDQSGGFYIGTERLEDVPLVIRALRESEEKLAPEQRVFGKIDALPDALPGTAEEQSEKIALLDDVRRLAKSVRKDLAPGSDEAKLVDELLPPEEERFRVLYAADLPAHIRQAFTEADGRVGLLLAVHPGPAYQEWSYRGIRRAVALLRALPLPERIRSTLQVSGPEMIFVDMMEAVQHDGPRASLLSLGLVLALLLVAFGFGRDALVTALASFVGLFGMLGLMDALGVRLNFLNYIAVPITIGIGVDYPFNVMARLRDDEVRAKLSPGFWQTAGAVALCSLTTMIGYAVLLLSDTGAIRSFGSAAVLGEITSIAAALLMVPCAIFSGALIRRARAAATGEEPEIAMDRALPRKAK